MSAFVLQLNPPGQPVARDDIEPLLAPVDYLGVYGRNLWTRGRIGIGALAYSPDPLAEDDALPCSDASGRYVLIGDIRLNDRDRLRRTLLDRFPSGARPKDAELVLAAYLRWGADCCNHLDGDYAFAVFDLPAQRLFAAGDPLGCYRLFSVALPGGALLITSEFACALAAPGIDLGFSMPDLMLWTSGTPLRHSGLFEQIQVIPPGSSIIADERGRRNIQWWSPGSLAGRIRYRDSNEYEQHYLELLRASVRDRMRTASGSVLVELSGGMDSSSIAACALDIAAERGIEVLALSHRYDHPDCAGEGGIIQGLREHLAVQSIDVDGLRILRDSYPIKMRPRRESPLAFDEPFQILAADAARLQGADVILAGTAGDEMTCGDLAASSLARALHGDWRVVAELIARARDRGQAPAGMLAANFLKPLIKYLIGARTTALLRQVRAAGTWPYRCSGPLRATPWCAKANKLLATTIGTRHLNAFQHEFLVDLSVTTSHCARDSYRLNAGRAGVAAYDPFFDLRIAAFRLGTPPEIWRSPTQAKLLPRKAMRNRLPASVCGAPKFTMASPQRQAWEASHAEISATLGRLQEGGKLGRQLGLVLDFPESLTQTLAHNMANVYAVLLAQWVVSRSPSSGE